MSMTLSLDTPMLSLNEYARRTGITITSVRRQCESGQLPFIQHHAGGTRYINMVQLTKNCSEANSNKPWNQ